MTYVLVLGGQIICGAVVTPDPVVGLLLMENLV